MAHPFFLYSWYASVLLLSLLLCISTLPTCCLYPLPSVVEAKPASEAKEVHTVAVPDPCFPYGPYGNFVNVGLERWLENRAQWTAREPGFTQ